MLKFKNYEFINNLNFLILKEERNKNNPSIYDFDIKIYLYAHQYFSFKISVCCKIIGGPGGEGRRAGRGWSGAVLQRCFRFEDGPRARFRQQRSLFGSPVTGYFKGRRGRRGR